METVRLNPEEELALEKKITEFTDNLVASLSNAFNNDFVSKAKVLKLADKMLSKTLTERREELIAAQEQANKTLEVYQHIMSST